MIVDSSALLAVLKREPEEKRLTATLFAAANLSMSAATMLESSMVAEGWAGAAGVSDLDDLVTDLNVHIVPFTPEHAALARDAFRRFGKGRHPAQLNFGDCMAYALAKAMGEPLLFKGYDFSQTDIEAAHY